MTEKVSIIVPVYNTAPYLSSCLNSVKNQSYKNIEIIVINDGSTDNSTELIKKYVELDNRFVLYEQSNQGLGYTRNRGLSLSNGKYIFFLDSDDILPKNAILDLVQAIESSKADYVAGKVLRFNKKRKYVPKRHREFNLYKENMEFSIDECPEFVQDSIVCNKLWRKDFIYENQLSFAEGKFYEDLFFSLKASILAKKIAVISSEVYYWRVREDDENVSITQERMKLKNTLDRIEALSNSREWLSKQKISSIVKEEYDRKCLLDILRLHASKYSLVEQTERKIWEEYIYKFVSKIPEKSAKNLPNTEKIIYDLVKDGDYENLERFSEMYLNTETEQLVVQENNQFFFKGNNRTIDISSYIKPKVTVKNVKKEGKDWILSGTLIIPKASKPIPVLFYANSRTHDKKIIIGELKSNPSDKKFLYPYMYQEFEVRISSEQFINENLNTTYDFYCKLKGNNDKIFPSRVNMDLSLIASYTIHSSGFTLELYSTKLNNLSIKVYNIKGKIVNAFNKVKLLLFPH